MRTLMTMTIAALLCFGCAAQKPEVDPAILALEKAARQIENDLRQLVLLQTETKQGGLRAVLPKTGPLGKRTTMKWNGPIGTVVKRVTRNINYKYKVLGAAPAVPITVSIDATKEKTYAVLDSIAWQAAGRAQILVDPLKKHITLAYLPMFGGTSGSTETTKQ